MKSTKSLSARHRQLIVALVAGGGLLSLLLLVIVSLQLHAIAKNYAFYSTTGGEAFPVYAIWKVQEGHPLYEWPNQESYQLTLYNFGFYHLYAAILKMGGACAAEIMLWGRYLTAAFALAGMWLQRRLILLLLPDMKGRGFDVAVWLVSFATWFNSYFPGSYSVSVRPDTLALVLSVAALGCFLRFVSRERLAWICAAALLWWAAWCVKQATVTSIFGAGVYLVAFRRWKPAVVLTVIFGGLSAAMLAGGSDAYRWNILTAPSVNSLNFGAVIIPLGFGIGCSLFVWSFLATFPWSLWLQVRQAGGTRFSRILGKLAPGSDSADVSALAFIIVFGGLLALVALSKTGSSLNQAMEVFVAATVLSFVMLFRLLEQISSAQARLVSHATGLLLLSMSLYPACQIGMNRMGPIVRVTRADHLQNVAFADFLKTLKKPLLIRDEQYALPWHSTDNRHPAIQVDPVFYFDAKARGFFKGEGIADLVRNHWLATLYIQPSDELYAVAKAAGYRRLPLEPAHSSYLNCYRQLIQDCELWVAPEKEATRTAR